MSERCPYEDLVARLCSGLRLRRLYFGAHPEVRACSDQVARDLAVLLDEGEKGLFFLGLAQGRLLHEGRFLIGSTILGRRLVEFLQRLQSGGLLFRTGVTAAEITGLLDVSSELSAPVGSLEEARTLLRARNVVHIELSPPYEDVGWFGQFLYDREEGGGLRDGGELAPVYQSLFDSVETAHDRAAAGRQLDLSNARTVVEDLLKAADGGFTDILRLVRYPDYDAFTVGHSVRVALLAVLVAHKLGAAQEFLIEVGAAGLLHDVGKAKIPDAILYKAGPLTPEERQTILLHPCFGAQILLEHRDAGPLAVGAAFGHHRRHDHCGYPKMERWSVTNRVTSLIQVCDVFEAITAIRPYKAALPPRRAYEIMLKDAGAFDPAALRAFVSAMGLYPPGSRVLLSGGEQGLVLAAGADFERPVVRITHAASGEELAEAACPILDLGAPEAAPISITQFLIEETSSPAVRADA